MRWPTNEMPRVYRFVVPVLGLWLTAWMVLSWAAIQDDALIHLRYADNLYLHHFITYDGVHPNYGASSLLYVGLLALLRGLTTSPQLPRAVSSVVHVLLFAGLALALGLRIPKQAKTARVAGLVLLTLLVTPSAVRWLEDGMETGLVVSVVTLMAWIVHQETETSRVRAVSLGMLAFLAVMLRTELLLVCAVVFLILSLEYWLGLAGQGASLRSQDSTLSQRRERMGHPDSGHSDSQQPKFIAASMFAVVVGSLAAVAVIVGTMHVLLPDTAVAKSHGIGHWLNPIHDTAVTLGGAFSFGAGMLAFWLLTLVLVTMRSGLTLRTALANCFCPVVLALSSLRGQEIQGVRYFAWTFAFSIMWNILELAAFSSRDREAVTERRGVQLLYIFAGLLMLELPVESRAMHRVLTQRSETIRVFESQHLEVLRSQPGVASDIGYIGYFTGADICDLAGLVNGREAARASSSQRVSACAKIRPGFMFLNGSQYAPMAAAADLDDWKVCGQYNFVNVRALDSHYLLVRPEIADEVCRATGRQPLALAAVFGAVPTALRLGQ